MLDTLLRCLSDSKRYFSSQSVSRSWLIRRSRTDAEINDLVTEIAYPSSQTHIHNYGLTKTILWLYGYDLATHLSPTSYQVVKFLADHTGREPHDLDEKDPAMWWGGYFTRYIAPLGNIATALTTELGTPVKVRDVQYTSWLLYSTKSLLKQFPSSESRKLSAATLGQFISENGLNVDQTGDRITDIELMDPYSSEVYAFLEGLGTPDT